MSLAGNAVVRKNVDRTLDLARFSNVQNRYFFVQPFALSGSYKSTLDMKFA